jgi:hypothetical protein
MDDAKKKKLIVALITEPTRRKACEVVGIDEKTLYNCMQDDDFIKEYNNTIETVMDDALCTLKLTILNSAIELNRIITMSGDDNTKLKAIKIALDSFASIRAQELHNQELKDNEWLNF